MKRDRHTANLAAAAAFDRRENPRQSRYDEACDAGYEAGPDYPLPAHLALPDDDPWMVALRRSRAALAALNVEAAETNLIAARQMLQTAIEHGRGMERAELRVRVCEFALAESEAAAKE